MKRKIIVIGAIYIFIGSTNCFETLRMYQLLMRLLG